MRFLKFFVSLFVVSFFFSCQSAIDKKVKDTKYSVYEFFGVEKRDLFKKKIKEAKENQEEAAQSFQNALERLKAVYHFDGGKLEKQYRSLDSSYTEAERRATAVHDSIKQVETVSQDLFAEWQSEIQQMQSTDLQARSERTLAETRTKYHDFHSDLKKSEAKMDPILAKLKDHVLFLKHNLNAKAIAGLKTESGKIQGDIESLIQQMNSSIAKADEFIKTM